MRRLLAAFLLSALASVFAMPAQASCHSAADRIYAEYLRFKATASPAVLAKLAAPIADLDSYFEKESGRIINVGDLNRLSEADVIDQQTEVTVKYGEVQRKLDNLRDMLAAVSPNDPSAVWLSQIDLPVVYGEAASARIFTAELPVLANFTPADDYARAKYDSVEMACAASLERAGTLLNYEPRSRGFFVACGQAQPVSKVAVGHYSQSHVILDNFTALQAHRGKRIEAW